MYVTRRAKLDCILQHLADLREKERKDNFRNFVNKKTKKRKSQF